MFNDSLSKLPLIDHSCKPYRLAEEVPGTRLPVLSLWGLHRCLFSGQVLQPPLAAPSRAGTPARFLTAADNTSQREQVLNALFQGTALDLLQEGSSYAQASPKTRDNRMTQIWHHYWGLPRDSGKRYSTTTLSHLTPTTPQDIHRVLSSVAQRMALLTAAYTNYGALRDLTQQLLLRIYPHQEAAIRLTSVEQRMTLLAVRALLYEDLGKYPAAWEWAAGRAVYAPDLSDGPSRPTIPASVFSPGNGLYSSAEEAINPILLPDLLCGEQRYAYHPASGSPLRQILTCQAQCRQFLLCGQPDASSGGTTVSGAGKTTSLRYLFTEVPQDWTLVYLPLAHVYSPRNLADPDNLFSYVRRHYHLDLTHRSHQLYLLMDGLDELVSSAGLERLCGDLEELSFRDDICTVVTSKHPLERLPGFEILSQYNQLWQAFLPCLVQPMTTNQRRGNGQHRTPGEDLLAVLDTPFLLSLYRATTQCSHGPRTSSLLRRWRVERPFRDGPKNATELFYCSLIAQLIRWFEANKGRERQSEADAFLLLHTLPAIAFQTLINEVCEGTLHPAGGVTIDQNYVAEIISLSLEGTQGSLSLFPGYQDQGTPSPVSLMLQQDLDLAHYLSGQVPSLFREDWVPGTVPGTPWRAEYAFANHSLRDYLASLHIANVFLMAQADQLLDRPALVRFYSCTLEFLPAEFISRAADFLRVLLPQGQSLEELLQTRHTHPFQSGFSWLLAGHIGGRLCEQLNTLKDPDGRLLFRWYDWASCFQKGTDCVPDLFQPVNRVAEYYNLTCISSYVAMSSRARQQSDYLSAIGYARLACLLQSRYPAFPNSDGQHQMSMIWWKKLSELYNHSRRYELATTQTEVIRQLLIPMLNHNEGSLATYLFDPFIAKNLDDYIQDPPAPYQPMIQETDIDLPSDATLFPWRKGIPTTPVKGRDLTPGLRPQIAAEAVSPVLDILASLRRMAAGADMSADPIFPDPDPNTVELAPIFVMMLERGLTRWQAYERQAFFGNHDLLFLCLQSLRAKAATIYSACSPGLSGQALNQLGCFLENQQEAFENDPRLPFFRKYPQFHLPVDGLEYDLPFVSAFRLFFRIYSIRRGPQPYSARKLVELLLRRKVRLDRQGQPAPCTPETPFTLAELDFLEQATARAASTGAVGTAYWRARYLHERARFLGMHTAEGQRLLEQARQALHTDWVLCRCSDRFDRATEEPDLYASLILTEERGLNSMDAPGAWPARYRRLSDYLQRQWEQTQRTLRFTTKLRPQCFWYEDCLLRLYRFLPPDEIDVFQAHFSFRPVTEN